MSTAPSPPVMIHRLWSSHLLGSLEHAVLTGTGHDHRLEGTWVGPIGGAPATIRYRVEVDGGWRTRAAQIDIIGAGAADGRRRFEIEVSQDRHWTVDGHVDGRLAGCVDIDLGWSPITNLLPIRRLGLDVGWERTIEAAWIRFPELELVPSPQTYQRLDQHRWRYRSGSFEAELHTDDAGLVLTYGDDDPIWTTAAGSPPTGE